MRAAIRLDSKVSKTAMYEPPITTTLACRSPGASTSGS
jgi:hypothetical protein